MEIKKILEYLEKEKISYQYRGDRRLEITRISSLKEIKPSSICWVKNEKYIDQQLIRDLRVNLSVVVTPVEIEGINSIITDCPKRTYFTVLNEFFPSNVKHIISEYARVQTKSIGKNVCIGANCFIGENVQIGDNTVIYPNVSIVCPCTIGSNCTIFPGAVIGSDGFGYYFDDNGVPEKVRHFGGVSIGNNVEIGANTCIDRGTIDDTTIYDDVKIDNLVHIAHNSIIHRGAIIIAGAIVCGSAEIGDRGYVAPGAIIKNQTHVGDDALVGLGAVVVENVSRNMVVMGMPAKEIRAVQKGDK